jgi:hypothetical protein
MINPSDRNILSAIELIKNSDNPEETYNKLIESFERKAYNIQEVEDYINKYFEENPIEIKDPPVLNNKIEEQQIKQEQKNNIEEINTSTSFEKQEPDIAVLRDIFDKLKKDRELKKEVYNMVFPSAGKEFSTSKEYVVERLIKEKGMHPLIAEEFYLRILSGRLKPYIPRTKFLKDKQIHLRIEEEIYNKIIPEPQQKIREMIEKELNSQQKKGVV